MLGALMYASKIIMEVLPNIHLLGTLICAITAVYRLKALYPIYIFVFITGLYGGFSPWWIPYLYVWTVLWGAVMLLPKNMPKKIAPFVYMAVCALHGFLFGVIYSPAQALLFGLDFKGMLAWIASGLPFDMIHGISNLFVGILICPLIALLRKAEKIAK
ncbi:MAG: hypothetical protein IKT50_00780 [Clostridia bacterium]|nr:hypothetical protein [Clostridia bacterium]